MKAKMSHIGSSKEKISGKEYLVKTDYTENIFGAPDDETVCWCSDISKHVIVDSIFNGKAWMTFAG